MMQNTVDGGTTENVWRCIIPHHRPFCTAEHCILYCKLCCITLKFFMLFACIQKKMSIFARCL